MGSQLPDDIAEMSFEQALSTLEEVVARMEVTDLPLEETLKLFEQGTFLAQRCNALLDQAELRVIELTQSTEKGLTDLPSDINN